MSDDEPLEYNESDDEYDEAMYEAELSADELDKLDELAKLDELDEEDSMFDAALDEWEVSFPTMSFPNHVS